MSKKYRKKTVERIVKYLTDMGQYDSIDDDLISVYAQNLSDIRRYSEKIEEDGELLDGELHPLIGLRQKAFINVTKLADKLGVLAYNRKRLSAGNTAKEIDNPFEEFTS